MTRLLGNPIIVLYSSILLIASIPSIMLPKTTCLLSSQGIFSKNIKKLRVIGIWASICHRHSAWLIVLENKGFIYK
ncbi:hypothetical protein BX661DRAFT_220976 [Kickxella alabastrina]|uniref:uncharacterized protein n=1 Tax=Kickxella alabastrina TaxID=61397 RepID=UPI00221E4F25|nr:uncharacterized protein BX661DRAFT_220976 [Kickxella alabastrina]KAI7829070.1 hypothetical protein BX661DRAFT_220976 [Kickxella alabastrina]